MLFKLFKHKISKNQLIGFTIANLIGLSIIFIGVQLYSDIYPILTSKDSFLQDEYIILTKQVSTFKSALGQSSSFTDKEIKEIEKQSFIEDLGRFEASHFDIKANINFIGAQFGITTDMFFESVPDTFIDIENKEWKYNSNTDEIPIIIPRSYLDLYNFGFSASKSLPKISENLINSIVLNITASGNGNYKTYKGRIIGFSKRINTILVPESFLKDANQTYAKSNKEEALRVIIKVKNSSDPELAKYIEQNNYLIDGNQLDTGKARYFLNMSISIVLFIGALISFLACYILILSIYLLVEKNIYSLENLALLGYPNSNIAKPYLLITTLLVAITTTLALCATYITQWFYIPFIMSVSNEILQTGLHSATFTFALLVFIGILTISFIIITHKIKQISSFKRN